MSHHTIWVIGVFGWGLLTLLLMLITGLYFDARNRETRALDQRDQALDLLEESIAQDAMNAELRSGTPGTGVLEMDLTSIAGGELSHSAAARIAAWVRETDSLVRGGAA